jgi:hypothetical protein
MSSSKVIKINSLNSTAKNSFDGKSQKTEKIFRYRTLNLGSYKLFFTVENNELIYKFI